MFNIDFIGIGSGKSGSTWLYKNIIEHPEVFDGNPKEINYFSYLFSKENIDWYHRQFRGSKGFIKGEFSVSYLDCPFAASRINSHFPKVRLICILRNPSLRIYSDYLHSIRKAEISSKMTFKEYIDNEEKLSYGLYFQKLQNYLKVFSKEQIKIIILEKALKEPEETIMDIYSFIGVKNTHFIPASLKTKINAARNYKFKIIEQIITNTSKFLNKKGYTLFVEKLKKVGIPELIRRMNLKREPVPDIPSNCKLILDDFYKRDISNLENLLGYEISEWKS